MAYILASQIAYNFGGECREIEHAYTESIVGYKVLSQRELAKEREEKRRWDNMTHLS